MTEEQRKLAEENHKLIYDFLHRKSYSVEEYYDLAAIGYCKAIRSFNPEKGSLSTYAFRCMELEIYYYLRSTLCSNRCIQYCTVSYDKLIDDEGQENSADMSYYLKSSVCVEDEVIDKRMFDEVIKKITKERDRKLVLLLARGYTQREVGSILNIKQPTVSRKLKRLKQHMEIEKCG